MIKTNDPSRIDEKIHIRNLNDLNQLIERHPYLRDRDTFQEDYRHAKLYTKLKILQQDDTFPGYLQPGRRQTLLYLLDENGEILQTKVLLIHTDGTDWHLKTDSFTGLGPDIYRIGIGRRDAWSSDYQLTVEWVDVTINVS